MKTEQLIRAMAADTARSPRTMTRACCLSTKSRSRPLKLRTVTFGYTERTSRAICTRSSVAKNGRLRRLSAMPTTRPPNRSAARRTRSGTAFTVRSRASRLVVRTSGAVPRATPSSV